jgi:hypothetical protein
LLLGFSESVISHFAATGEIKLSGFNLQLWRLQSVGADGIHGQQSSRDLTLRIFSVASNVFTK